ncbi:hypothetical protein [Bdellovibrio sp. HCB2-146]|uniref:hypothetical protein n=1 Tax=Bdellovibrio sp. HCB2-146 TaxID=3394362 RepID=UPI0039BD3491
MNALKSIYMLAGVTAVMLIGMAAFNYAVDPQCFYHCDTLDTTRQTVNVYYQVAQKIAAHPDAEQIILGSSRGETTSPLWLEKETGLKTLNLSVGGAEMKAKLAFLNIAQERLKLKRVIWLADYFELITEHADAKIKNSPYLRRYIPESLRDQQSVAAIKDLLKLIDHNTLEASIYSISHRDQINLNQGASSDADFELCASDKYKGKETPASLKKEVDSIYQSYVNQIFPVAQNPAAWAAFEQKVTELTSKGVAVVIVIAPYNPTFIENLKKEYPDIYQRHLEWIDKLRALKSSSVSVVNFFEGIPSDDRSPAFWHDGVHFSCKGAQLLLQKSN